MKDLGQLVITDHMINRVSQNWRMVCGRIFFWMNFILYCSTNTVPTFLTVHIDVSVKEMRGQPA